MKDFGKPLFRDRCEFQKGENMSVNVCATVDEIGKICLRCKKQIGEGDDIYYKHFPDSLMHLECAWIELDL